MAKPAARPAAAKAHNPPVRADRVPRVVGIGASAGGLEALEVFFRTVPANCPLSFVVVVHLHSGGVSELTHILSRHSRISIVDATDATPLKAGCAYVRTPGTVVTLRNGRLRVGPPASQHAVDRPIDTFLVSLAEERDDEAIGILLSGSNDDGTAGLAAIQRCGGLTLVQGDGADAPRFPQMPQAARDRGVVDLVLPVAAMPGKLMDMAQGWGEPFKRPSAGTLKTIHSLLRSRTGHDFSQYKERTFLRRVYRRMQLLRVKTVAEYLRQLQKTPDELGALFRDLLIGVTEFFRDREAFAALASQVIPRLFQGKGVSDEVRIWVPACATGEEAYSIAMLAREHLDTLENPPRVQIFATDIDEQALGVARIGRYPAAALQQLTPERAKRFFGADDGHFRITRELRDLCIFSVHSAIKDPPFSRLDLVSCRNLMIYLDADLQAELIRTFHYALRSGGFLFLGISESLSRHSELFVAMDKKNRLFQRHDLAAVPAIPLLSMRGGRGPRLAPPQPTLSPLRDQLMRRSTDRVLEQFAPPYVVVDDAGDVAEYSSHTGRFLEPPAGPPNRNLVAMARRELRTSLRALLRDVRHSQQPASGDAIILRDGDTLRSLRVTVEPIPQLEAKFYLVVFVESASAPAAAAANSPATDVDESHVQHLESELKETKEQMQSLIEELETSNEELRSSNEELLSMNEELQSTNEELQTSKEELQSVNEELQTVNSELNGKIEELDRVNSDLRNVFEGTEVATIFLDRNLIVRSFTPAVTSIFKLIPADRGRPLTDIVHQLSYATLAQEVREALRRERAAERRLSTVDGLRNYLMRILPYRNSGGEVDGALLTFVDITSVTQAEERQRLLAEELSHRGKNMLTVVNSIASQTLKRAGSLKDFSDAFQGRLGALALTQDFLSQGHWVDAPLGGIIRTLLMPYGSANSRRIVLEAPANPVPVTPRAALTLGLAVHELAANAAKYGALSGGNGMVRIKWGLRGRGAARVLYLSWCESGGPPVQSRKVKPGFGTELVTRSIEYELHGQCSLRYARTGLVCEISVPANAKIVAPALAAPEQDPPGRN